MVADDLNIAKLPNETEEQYIWRVGKLIDTGLVTSWKDINGIVNTELGIEEDKWRDESTFRKKYQTAKKFYESVFSKAITNENSKSLERQRRELERARIAYRDERNAWNKQNYIDSRIEQKLDYLEQQLRDIGNVKFNTDNSNVEPIVTIDNAPALLVALSDLHIGQTFSSAFGEYNTDIAAERMEKYLNKVIQIGRTHKAQYVYVDLLGDQISGNIHQSIQVSNRENIIEQIKKSAELISSFCVKLSAFFDRVFIIGVSGNHSRLITDKEKAIHDERLDDLITWIVEQITSNIENIVVLHNNLDTGISELNIKGKHYISVHGDYDSLTKTGIGNLVMMLGFFPDAILAGHLHYPSATEINGIPVIQSGSLAGSGDNYTIEHRLTGEPNQTVLVCTDVGIECIYNVKL
jgi:predicted phosphodiesterase